MKAPVALSAAHLAHHRHVQMHDMLLQVHTAGVWQDVEMCDIYACKRWLLVALTRSCDDDAVRIWATKRALNRPLTSNCPIHFSNISFRFPPGIKTASRIRKHTHTHTRASFRIVYGFLFYTIFLHAIYRSGWYRTDGAQRRRNEKITHTHTNTNINIVYQVSDCRSRATRKEKGFDKHTYGGHDSKRHLRLRRCRLTHLTEQPRARRISSLNCGDCVCVFVRVCVCARTL